MRTSSVLLLLLSILLMLPDAASSAETRQEIASILAQPTIGLNDLFRLAELVNPRLAVARTGVAAQAGRVRQAGLYPNPELEVGVEELSLDNPDVHKRRIGLTQPLALGGRLGAAVETAKAKLASADHQLHQERRQALRRVQQLWAEQLHYREAEALLAELMMVANGTLEIARTRFESRAAPESHVTRAMLEVYDLEIAQQQLAQDRVRGSAEFAAFFGDAQVPLDRLAGSLDPDPAEASLPAHADSILAEHPSLLAARMKVIAAKAALGQAKAERIPDLNVFVAYGNSEPMNENYIEGGFSFPLPIFDRNQGRVAETRSLITQAEHRARLVENNLTIALLAAFQRHEMLHEQLDTMSERIAPAAERGLDQAQEAYRVGRMMFLELVDAQRTFADVHRRTIELRRDLALAEADVLSLLGTGGYAESKTTPDADIQPATEEQS